MEPLKQAKGALKDALDFVLVKHAEAAGEEEKEGNDAVRRFFDACKEIESVLGQVKESKVMKEKDLDEVSFLPFWLDLMTFCFMIGDRVFGKGAKRKRTALRQV